MYIASVPFTNDSSLGHIVAWIGSRQLSLHESA